MGENSLLADIMNKKYTHKKNCIYIYTQLQTKQSIEIKNIVIYFINQYLRIGRWAFSDMVRL